jgi:hypothetical protein
MPGATGAAHAAAAGDVKPTPTIVATSASDAPAVAIAFFLFRNDIPGLLL